MKREEKREQVREWYKHVKKMSLTQFHKFLETSVQSHVDIAEDVYTKTLRQEFGFGDKRIARFKEKAQQIYDDRSHAGGADDN